MVSFDMDLACGSRAVEEATLEGTWASLILSTESNEECFSGTIGWWGALVLKKLPQKHCHEESTVQVITQRGKNYKGIAGNSPIIQIL